MVQSNIMILMDNSAAMNDTVNWLQYDPGTTYPLPPFPATSYRSPYVYNKVNGLYSLYARSVTLINSSDAQAALGGGRILLRYHFRNRGRSVSREL